MSTVNNTTITRDVNEAVQTVWPDRVKSDVLLPISDATPYVKTAA
jgi:hypothetical protein